MLKKVTNREILNMNDTEIQCESDNDKGKISCSSYDFDSNNSENSFDISQEETESQKTTKNKKSWSDREIKCLIMNVKKYGNVWKKILKSNSDIFINKTPDNLRNKASQLKKDPTYSSLFD